MGGRADSLSQGLPSAFLHVPPKDTKGRGPGLSINYPYRHRYLGFSTGGQLGENVEPGTVEGSQTCLQSGKVEAPGSGSYLKCACQGLLHPHRHSPLERHPQEWPAFGPQVRGAAFSGSQTVAVYGQW